MGGGVSAPPLSTIPGSATYDDEACPEPKGRIVSEPFDWSAPKTYSQPVAMDDYLTMPEDVSRSVEIKVR